MRVNKEKCVCIWYGALISTGILCNIAVCQHNYQRVVCISFYVQVNQKQILYLFIENIGKRETQWNKSENDKLKQHTKKKTFDFCVIAIALALLYTNTVRVGLVFFLFSFYYFVNNNVVLCCDRMTQMYKNNCYWSPSSHLSEHHPHKWRS